MVNRPDMTDDCRCRTRDGQPFSRNRRVEADAGNTQDRYEPCSDNAFADINDHNSQGKPGALSAQRVGTTRIAAAEIPDIDAASQRAYEQRSHKGSEQITDQELDAEFEHWQRALRGIGGAL